MPVPRIRLGSGAYLTVVTEGVYGPLTVALHDVVDVELVSDAYRADGALAAWQTPTSSDPAVLAPDAPAGLPPCPTRATCTGFTATALGVANVLIVGPTGGLCDDTGANCVAVAPIAYRISVTVAPAAPSTSTAPTPPASKPTPQPTAPSSALSSPDASTPPTTAPPTTQGGSGRLVLTDKDADGDATFTVKVGTIIEVDLTVTPPDGVGAARSTNEAVVATISARGDESSASEAVFRAVAPGTANLGAMIFTPCASNMGCAAAAGYIFAISVDPAR